MQAINRNEINRVMVTIKRAKPMRIGDCSNVHNDGNDIYLNGSLYELPVENFFKRQLLNGFLVTLRGDCIWASLVFIRYLWVKRLRSSQKRV
jgi:hypothetical protein